MSVRRYFPNFRWRSMQPTSGRMDSQLLHTSRALTTREIWNPQYIYRLASRYQNHPLSYHFWTVVQRTRLWSTINSGEKCHMAPGAEYSRMLQGHHYHVHPIGWTGSVLVHRNLVNGKEVHYSTQADPFLGCIMYVWSLTQKSQPSL